MKVDYKFVLIFFRCEHVIYLDYFCFNQIIVKSFILMGYILVGIIVLPDGSPATTGGYEPVFYMPNTKYVHIACTCIHVPWYGNKSSACFSRISYISVLKKSF